MAWHGARDMPPATHAAAGDRPLCKQCRRIDSEGRAEAASFPTTWRRQRRQRRRRRWWADGRWRRRVRLSGEREAGRRRRVKEEEERTRRAEQEPARPLIGRERNSCSGAASALGRRRFGGGPGCPVDGQLAVTTTDSQQGSHGLSVALSCLPLSVSRLQTLSCVVYCRRSTDEDG